jgi:hypothetical protein
MHSPENKVMTNSEIEELGSRLTDLSRGFRALARSDEAAARSNLVATWQRAGQDAAASLKDRLSPVQLPKVAALHAQLSQLDADHPVEGVKLADALVAILKETPRLKKVSAIEERETNALEAARRQNETYFGQLGISPR